MASAEGISRYGVNGVYNWTDTHGIDASNSLGLDAIRLNKSSGPIADLVKAGLSNFGITGPLGDVIARDIAQALPTLEHIGSHSAGTGLIGSVLQRPEFAGALQGVEVAFHAPIISRAAASAIGAYTGATTRWNGSPLDAVTYLGRPFYLAPVGILMAPLLPWTHPCSISCK